MNEMLRALWVRRLQRGKLRKGDTGSEFLNCSVFTHWIFASTHKRSNSLIAIAFVTVHYTTSANVPTTCSRIGLVLDGIERLDKHAAHIHASKLAAHIYPRDFLLDALYGLVPRTVQERRGSLHTSYQAVRP